MNAKQKNSLLAVGLIAGLLSLPTTWLTIHNAQIGGDFGKLFGSTFNGMSVPVTGLNGKLALLVEAPLWFVVGVAVVAGVLQLMRHSQTFAIPKVAEWATAVVGVVWTSIPIIVVLFSGQVSPGVGWPLGMFCAAAPLVCLIVPTHDSKQAESGMENHRPE
jgi:hypothetical protein